MLPQPYRIILYPEETQHPFCGTELKRFRRKDAAIRAHDFLKRKFPSLMRGAIIVDYTDEQKPCRVRARIANENGRQVVRDLPIQPREFRPHQPAAKLNQKGHAIVRGRSHDQGLMRP